ncbi:MAG: WG repeat-containing protein, partial [Clostridia bacterium]|nr:WG repeat-containing protein [Clostridia bacterium]
VIDYLYDCGTSFKEGLAAVSKGEKSGYIDKDGNVVVDFIYDVATPFDKGRAIVRAEERWGVLDRESLNVLWR